MSAFGSSRRRRGLAAVAAVGAAAIALAGCTTSGGGDADETASSEGGTITVATTNAFTSFNSETPQSNLDTNGMVQYLTGSADGIGYGSFYQLDPEFNIVHDESLGTYEAISEDPLTVKYTIADGATWSDGEAITTADLLTTWAIKSGYYDSATLDPESGEVTSGTQYFQLAGSTAGLDTTSFPEVDEDENSVTLTYDTPYVDWELVSLLGKPAHVLAEKAGLTTDELVSLLEELPEGDPENPADANADLQAVADFWNTGYDVTEFPNDDSLLVSSGPFVVTDFVPESSITLEKNPEYAGEHEPAYDQLIIRFIGDANAQVTALQNGEVNAVYPQPSADTLSALDSAGANVSAGDQVSYDHLDLNFGSDVFADADVREAFLKTIPRQQILESIITPVNPDAEVLDSQIYVPSQAEYADAAAANGYDAYTEPDIEGAKELLDGATPTVRILYNTENPNRVDTFALIKEYAEQAGFQIEDAGSPDWSSLLTGGEYEASIFGWISPGAGNAGLPQIFKTAGGGNYNGYSNADVDSLVDETQVTLDADALKDLKIQIDTKTAEDFYGLPLFQLPGLFADNGTVSGVEYFGGQTGIVWNAADWTLSE